MSADNDSRFERGSVVGNVNVPLMALPFIRGSVRRHDPDGSHTQAYFPNLAGKALTVEVGDETGVIANVTVNFATNNYSDAVAAVNAASPLNFLWLESNGFAAVQTQHAGGTNYIRIAGGTAALVLGIAVSPQPGSYAQAGDVAPPPPDKVQANPQSTELLSHDEDLTTSNLNRAILGALIGTDQKLWDLDREIVQYKVFTATAYNTGGAANKLKITDGGAANERLSVDALFDSIAEVGNLSKAIAIMTNDSNPQALYDNNGVQAQALHVSYSVGPGAPVANGVITWGSGGVDTDITGSFVWISQKTPVEHAIAAISGSTVYCPGANFVTRKIQPRDQISIDGATNLGPFSHNGLFAVVSVPDEEHLVLRPVAQNETKIVTGVPYPQRLNHQLQGGQVYGNVACFVGKFITIQGPSNGANALDNLFIMHNILIAPGTVVKVRLPVATTLREALLGSFLQNQSFLRDANIAYVNKTNQMSAPVPGVGSNPGSWAYNSGLHSPYFLKVWENQDLFGRKQRFYIDPAGMLRVSWNCFWDQDALLWKSDTPTPGGNGGGSVVQWNGTDVQFRIKHVDGGGAANTWTDSIPPSVGCWDTVSAEIADLSAALSGSLEVGGGLLTSGPLARTARLLSKYVPAGTSGDATLGMTLIWESDPASGGTSKYRLYVGSVNNELRFTTNARWDGTNWNKDVNGTQAISMSSRTRSR
jgi:hypothetical protein